MNTVSFPLIPCSCNTPAAKIATSHGKGVGLMPGKFGYASNGSMFSNARNVYGRTTGKYSSPSSNKDKYAPPSSSSYTYLKKATAIGKSSRIIPINPTNNKRQLAFAGVNINDSKRALQKARSGGTNYRNKNNSVYYKI
jgi:hypothetical protein